MQHARSTLKKIFSDTIRRAGGEQSPMLVWPLACGAAVADKTSAVGFEHGVLSVVVPDVLWRSQLQVFRQPYMATLNEYASEKVTDIKFILAGKLKPSAR